MEIWKNVNLKNYEMYEVSSLGNVRRNGKLLKKGVDRYGYLRVNLCNNNIRKTRTIHRLVALAFIENPNNCLTVNHKDGNKKNNMVENLEWVTSQENTKHAQENELYKFWNIVEVFKEKTKEPVGRYKSIRDLCKKLKLVNRTEVTIAINKNFSYRGYSFKKVIK